MTRLEYIKTCNSEQLAKMFCKVIETAFDNYENDYKVVVRFCDHCPATDSCHKNHAGFIDWLEEKV